MVNCYMKGLPYSEFTVILQKIPNEMLAVFGIYCNFEENSE